MTKSTIAIFTITLILLATTFTAQAVYGEDFPISIQSGGTGSEKSIPDWVKSQFEWYLTGEIDEKTLLTSMNWMFDNNIMYLSQEAAQEVQDMRNEIDDLKYELEETKAAIANDLEIPMRIAFSPFTCLGPLSNKKDFTDEIEPGTGVFYIRAYVIVNDYIIYGQYKIVYIQAIK